ncbi:MAG: hypothetical protein WA459_10385 [Stellaceae bacterium]
MIVEPRRRVFRSGLAIALALPAVAGGAAAFAQSGSAYFLPGNLVLSRVVYDNNPSNVVADATQLPPGCVPDACATAIADGTYPYVFNNDTVDGSFGIASKIILDQLTPSGAPVNSLEVPNSAQNGVPPTKDQMVGSFSSKSEVALNLSTSGSYLTFMGYLAPIDAIDVSNSNTPAVLDPTNPVPGQNFRVVAQVDGHGKFHFTQTNAYSGNNGRAAILNDSNGADVIYTAGNAGNGGNPQPDGIIIGAGAQIMTPEVKAMAAQDPGLPTPLGSFDISQLPSTSSDKVGKDTNFRGLTIFNNVVYYTKGSGGNGVNTVYFVDTSGEDTNGNPLACPTGSGVPAANAALPTHPLDYDAEVLQTKGLTPRNMCILNGFPTALKSKTSFPFGIWFADANTLYVAGEGDGNVNYDKANGVYTKKKGQVSGGLQKWAFDGTKWKLAYTLTAGLNLGEPYTVSGYPTSTNTTTGLPWSPATDGLRNLTGRVNAGGTVTIWAVTSTVSGNGDQGADPNKLVTITDAVAATTLPSTESFSTLKTAGFGEVLRGVSFTPGTAVAQR